jgi:hypothetical protein
MVNGRSHFALPTRYQTVATCRIFRLRKHGPRIPVEQTPPLRFFKRRLDRVWRLLSADAVSG